MAVQIDGIAITSSVLAPYRRTCDCMYCTVLREILCLSIGDPLPPINTRITSRKECKFCHRETAICGSDSGGYFCVGCWNARTLVHCQQCDGWFEPNRGNTPWASLLRRGGESVCARCADALPSHNCHACGSRLVESIHSFCSHNDRVYCETCFSQLFVYCASCGNVVGHEEEQYRLSNGNVICERCFNAHYEECEDCGDVYDPQYDCECSRGLLRYYSFTPRAKMHIHDSEKLRRDSLTFGAEVEVEYRGPRRRNSVLLDLHKMSNGFWYFKSDASIDDGFEIVTHPFTFKWLKTHQEFIDSLFEHARDNGCIGAKAPSCGMHVHINKEAFSTLHLWKFMELFYNDAPFTEMLAKRSGRRFTSYAGIHKEGKRDRVMKARTGSQVTGDRHCAINLGRGSTAEVRIFRSVDTLEDFNCNIEICAAAYWYTKDASMRKIDRGSFREFVSNNRKMFPALDKYLALAMGV